MADDQADERPALTLRLPRYEDEAQAAAADADLADEGFAFTFRQPGQTWDEYLEKIENDRNGIDLAPGLVPATMLFAVVADQIVGRVHIRHHLTPALLEDGGHIGYGVHPAHRRRGCATEMLRQGLEQLRDLGVTRILVTCNDDNIGSIRTIERCGGQLEDKRNTGDGSLKRRYWIDLD